ncbi:MAG: ParA family protein [Novosphingobium sp.]|nr:ParA family protein [Novosphingobium sp.]
MKVVTFVNMKGGVGKTTVAVNVADALARRHDKRVLIVDVDPQFNATQCLYSGDDYVEMRADPTTHTIFDLFNDGVIPVVSPISGISETEPLDVEDIRPWKYRDNLHILAGNLEIYRLDMAPGSGRELRLKRYVEALAKADVYDYVVIDTPPTPSTFMTSAILASDYYVIPVRPEPLSRVGIDLLTGVIARVIKNHGHKIENAGVVLTMMDARTTVYYDALSFLDSDEKWAGKRFKTVLPQRTQIAKNQGDQRLILDSNKEDAKRAIAGITNELLERVGDDGI